MASSSGDAVSYYAMNNQDDISDIQADHQNDTPEQKDELGDEATPELSEQKRKERFSQMNNDARSVQPSRITQKDNKWRCFLMALSRKLSDEDANDLSLIYSNIPPSERSQSAAELLFYLDNKWDEDTDKFVALQDSMKAIGRKDICSDIEVMKRELEEAPKSTEDQIDASPFVEKPKLEEPVNPEKNETSKLKTENLSIGAVPSQTKQKESTIGHGPVNLTISNSKVTDSSIHFGGQPHRTTNYYGRSSNKNKEEEYEKAESSGWKDDENNTK